MCWHIISCPLRWKLSNSQLGHKMLYDLQLSKQRRPYLICEKAWWLCKEVVSNVVYIFVRSHFLIWKDVLYAVWRNNVWKLKYFLKYLFHSFGTIVVECNYVSDQSWKLVTPSTSNKHARPWQPWKMDWRTPMSESPGNCHYVKGSTKYSQPRKMWSWKKSAGTQGREFLRAAGSIHQNPSKRPFPAGLHTDTFLFSLHFF